MSQSHTQLGPLVSAWPAGSGQADRTLAYCYFSDRLKFLKKSFFNLPVTPVANSTFPEFYLAWRARC